MKTMILRNQKLQIIAVLAISLVLLSWAAVNNPKLMLIIGTVSWNR